MGGTAADEEGETAESETADMGLTRVADKNW
jgi:hypothetical protein